jgi:two-component system, OmpR family, alkaline phosphatase synthesis response regulator PhoP
MFMNLNKKTIIVCDDDEGILDIISFILKERGYTVVALKESGSVIQTALSVNPIVILLDVWIPGINGNVLTTLLKKNPKTKHIPVVLISANNHTERIAKESGADGYLCKPFDVVDLENIVNKFVPSQ